jgi:hypothetical protein
MADVSNDWEKVYQQALSETDLASLTGRGHAAEYAICKRWEELEDEPHALAELERINQAVLGLFQLKTEKLKYPSFVVSPTPLNDRLLPRIQQDGFKVHN